MLTTTSIEHTDLRQPQPHQTDAVDQGGFVHGSECDDYGRSLKNGPTSFSRRGGEKRAVSKRADRSANDIRASVDR